MSGKGSRSDGHGVSVQPLLLSIPEVAVSLRVCRATVYRLIDTQGLPVVRLGRRAVRVSVAALEQWVQEREVA